jgi:hypothetical protein
VSLLLSNHPEIGKDSQGQALVGDALKNSITKYVGENTLVPLYANNMVIDTTTKLVQGIHQTNYIGITDIRVNGSGNPFADIADIDYQYISLVNNKVSKDYTFFDPSSSQISSFSVYKGVGDAIKTYYNAPSEEYLPNAANIANMTLGNVDYLSVTPLPGLMITSSPNITPATGNVGPRMSGLATAFDLGPLQTAGQVAVGVAALIVLTAGLGAVFVAGGVIGGVTTSIGAGTATVSTLSAVLGVGAASTTGLSLTLTTAAGVAVVSGYVGFGSLAVGGAVLGAALTPIVVGAVIV